MYIYKLRQHSLITHICIAVLSAAVCLGLCVYVCVLVSVPAGVQTFVPSQVHHLQPSFVRS